MAKFQGGVLEMARALALMPSLERKRLLVELFKRDPKMAQEIESRLYSLEDLRYITPKMMAEFLRMIKMSDLGTSLKLYPEQLRQEIYGRVSSSMREEIKHHCETIKMPLSKVEEIHSKLLSLFRKLIDEGKLVISKDDQLV